jgi:hypothetical protein
MDLLTKYYVVPHTPNRAEMLRQVLSGHFAPQNRYLSTVLRSPLRVSPNVALVLGIRIIDFDVRERVQLLRHSMHDRPVSRLRNPRDVCARNQDIALPQQEKERLTNLEIDPPVPICVPHTRSSKQSGRGRTQTWAERSRESVSLDT